jgi:hypothetical protein
MEFWKNGILGRSNIPPFHYSTIPNKVCEEVNMSKKRLIDRRSFIRSGMAAIGSFLMLSSTEKNAEAKETDKKIIHRTLGNTGIKVPIVSMGMVSAGNPSLVRAALDAGIVYIDTAQAYHRGQSEELVGEVVKSRSRDSYIVSTKVGFSPPGVSLITGLYTAEATEEAYLKNVDISLKRFGLDYVDILYHHKPWRRESALFEPILKAMEKVKKSGKARFLGVSYHRNEVEVTQAAIDSKLYDVIMIPYNFKQKHYIEVRQAIAKAAQAGLGVVAMKVMGGVVAQDPLKPFDASAALKWVLQDSNVHTAVPGFSTFDEMKIDLSVMENVILTDPEKDYRRKEASIPGLYCQGCGHCVKQCIAKLPIPDLMRAYMYTYGYRKPSIGRELVVSLGLPRHVCDDCGECRVKCTNGWNIATKIRDVARLRDVPSEFITV